MRLGGRLLQSRLRIWRRVMHIDPAWQIATYIVTSAANMPKGCEDAQACIDVHPHFYADLHVNPWKIDDVDELDKVVRHELGHIINHPVELRLNAAYPNHEKIAEWEIEQANERWNLAIDGALEYGRRKR
jgi:hypothetical protein